MIIDILDYYTNLTKDVDLFYLEMPLDKSGCWLSERGGNINTGSKDYDIFYRGKNKRKLLDNLTYLTNTLYNLNSCDYNGESFKLTLNADFQYIGKDSEGYYVFTSTTTLL